jgi:phage tail sheath protein FI
MPGPYTYPGVYIEEIPSGVRTIAGVSTSDTAFVDFFPRGPMNQAVRITSFADFERVFGGLDTRSEGSYAIQQYYLNGGQVAWVVRVAGGNPRPASLDVVGGSLPQNVLTIQAASEGVWGNNVEIGIDYRTRPTGLFNLAVREVVTRGGRRVLVNSEVHRNLSMDVSSPRYAVDVVAANSSLVRLVPATLGELPAATADDVTRADLLQNPEPNAAYVALNDPANPASDGTPPGSAEIVGAPSERTGMHALSAIEPFIFNILCLPSASALEATAMFSVVSQAAAFCEAHRAFLIVDPPMGSDLSPQEMVDWMVANDTLRHRNAAIYYPPVRIPDRLNEDRLRTVAPSGTLAGVYARIDSTRGVWKAPAGTEASLRGASLARTLNDLENGALNPLGINVLRNFPIFGNVSWGARTLDGADQQASEWKYIPVRRMALFIEESLFQGTKWVVFEPNDEPLWAQIRLNVGAFMQNLFRQGAFQGRTPREAYFVKCDRETTTQNDINLGIVNIVVGFAPLKPAEFVVIKIQQMAGQIET